MPYHYNAMGQRYAQTAPQRNLQAFGREGRLQASGNGAHPGARACARLRAEHGTARRIKRWQYDVFSEMGLSKRTRVVLPTPLPRGFVVILTRLRRLRARC